MTDIPYEVIDDDRGPRVVRGADIIGWTWEARHAESFARELNALENERMRYRVALDKVARACGGFANPERVSVEFMEAIPHEVESNITALRARLAKLEVVAKAAREVAKAWDADNGSGVLTDEIDDLVGDLNAALEATDGE